MRLAAPARTALACGVLASLAASFAGAPSVFAASRRPLVAARGMVVAPEREAAGVGLAVLRRGGNAIDAAVAMAFALAVTYPRAGNLGGGGFMIYRAPDGSHAALDFRETAPAALTPAMFADASGRIDPERSRSGGLSVGVPGTVSGILAAHKRWGSRPLAELVEPAIRFAELGVLVSERTAEILVAENGRLAADPAAAAVFTRNGARLSAGSRLIQKDLATTLRAISARGTAGFYEGPVAESIVKAVAAAGGVMTREDLARYRAIERTPLIGSYRGKTVVTFPPPSSGGVVLLQALAMLERFDLAASGAGASLTLHRIAEAERRAFADRTVYLGDPDAVDVPVAALLDPAYLAGRSATIRDDEASSSSTIHPGALPGREGTNTLHLSVADDRGGAVALTTTLNSWYGAALVAPGTGVLLNNEIDDFSLGSGIANQFGLIGGAANAVRGGKRPLSSMCPTIVENTPPGPRPLLILGAPGGPTIISSVLQTIVHVVDDGMSLQEAVDAPRIHHQWLPDEILYERGALPSDVAEGLRRRGHALKERGPIGNVCAIGLDAQGRYTGAPDPRDEAEASGY